MGPKGSTGWTADQYFGSFCLCDGGTEVSKKSALLDLRLSFEGSNGRNAHCAAFGNSQRSSEYLLSGSEFFKSNLPRKASKHNKHKSVLKPTQVGRASSPRRMCESSLRNSANQLGVT